jgi:LysR family transcriptional regulator of beta-lactamase
VEIETGGYWLTRLKSRRATAGMRIFREWLLGAAAAS